MGFFKTSKKVAGHVFNFKVSQWLDYETLKWTAVYFIKQLRSLFTIKSVTQTETFEEAYDRLELTPKDLEQNYLRYSLFILIFFSLGILLIAYGYYLKQHLNLKASILSFLLAFYSFILAFRYHFWRYQIKKQKLGCTLQEWCSDLFRMEFFRKMCKVHKLRKESSKALIKEDLK